MNEASRRAEYEVPAGLWERLATRIASEAPAPAKSATSQPEWQEPAWQAAGSGITYKILAADAARERVSLMVRLVPGASYPPHRHAGVEELHLLDGELWIDHRKLVPGDYYRAVPGTSDSRVWSETGCTCVLLTSAQDVLR